MLHIFHVDRGQMLTLDIQFAMQTVRNLQSAIRQFTSVPENKQILMISGGEVLDTAQRVAKYSGAGTETNPIFLILKNPSDANSLSKNGSESSFLGESYSSFSLQVLKIVNRLYFLFSTF